MLINTPRRKVVSLIASIFFAPTKIFAETKECAAIKTSNMPFLRGVNFTGISHEVGSQEPSLNASKYYLGQKKMNVVRLNITWEWIQPRLNENLDPIACSIIERQMERIFAMEGYIIIELHNYGRRNVNGVSQIIGESSSLKSEDFSNVWEKIAQRWGSNQKVIFALMNEPHDQNTEVLVAVSNAAIASIRRTGSNNLIMISGNGWNSMAWDKNSENQRHMLKITDEKNNYCFDVHHYFDDWSQGQTPNVRINPIKSIQDFTEWAKINKRRGFCGEFACHVNKRGFDACRSLLKYIETNSDVFIGWAWWGAGGPWQPDYLFLLDPFASVTSATNPDPAGSLTWENPVDRPQMKVLQEFLPSCATTFNAWLIEEKLSDCLTALYRRGDFSTSGEWKDSSKNNVSAISKKFIPQMQADGGVKFSRTSGYLEALLKRTEKTESLFAMISTASVSNGLAQTVLATLVNGSVDGPSLGISTVGELKSGLFATVSNSCLLRSQVPVGTKTLINSVRNVSELPSAVVMSYRVNALASKKSNSLSWPNMAWPSNAVSIVGAKDAEGNEFLDGVLHDLAIFSRNLSIEETQKVEGRLYWDSGLAHQLPANHPYRVRAPSTI
jgi:endoglucanase